CAPSRHAPKHQPHALPPLPGQKIKFLCHHEVSTMTACTHVAYITRVSPHGFCARPVVGTRPTTPFDPQRDRWHRTASAMKPMYRLPHFFFFLSLFRFSFFFSFFLFFFSSPVRLRPPSTHIRTPSSR